MNTLQDLGSWGSNLLGQAQTQLGPTASAAADFAQRGSHIVRSGAKAVRTSIKENLTTHFGAAHTFEEPGGGGAWTVNEVGQIAEGAFGAVVKVTDPKTGKAYALKKIVCQEGVQVASSYEAALQEAKILRRLPPHPNIVQCLGYSTSKHPGGVSTVKVLMELCCGGHLLDFMDSKNGNLSPRDVMESFVQIVDGVCHLHSQRPPIQHRDLKVENVLRGVQGSGAWKLCDFGSCSTEVVPPQELPRATLMNIQEDIDKTVTMLYRPPEMADVQLNFQKGYTISEQCDVWMLGCILYTLAFYRHPFQDNATVLSISNAKYFIPDDHPMAKSKKLCGLIHWLLAAHPSDRPSSPQLAEVLRNFARTSHESLMEMMPQAVRDKIQRIQVLFAKRGNDSDLVIPSDTADAKQKLSPQKQLPRAQRSEPKREQAASPGALGQNGSDGFDLRFALAPETSSEAPLPSRKSAPAALAAAAAVGASNDLLSFASPGNVAATGSTSKPPPAAPAATNLGLDDLLGLDGAPGPASLSRAQTVPSMAAAGATEGAAAGEDWCDFTSFTSAPAPLPAQSPSLLGMNGQPGMQTGHAAPVAAGGQLGGFEDFADFTSAPPLPAAQPMPPAVASMATGVASPMGGSQPRLSASMAGDNSLFQAAATSDLPKKVVSAPAVAFMPSAASTQQVATPCGQAARTANPVGGSTGTAATDLSAMLSQQMDLLDL
mmetsp:Transcript_78425/g.229944  ORF Transcript_78425/g.229944 Transcript_78425/m.229944 type:complete len:715 (-) Transcript_78425:101-2245(-)